MNSELTQKIIEIYPEIFSNRDRKSPIIRCGIECNDGWFELLKRCIEGVAAIIKKYPLTKVQVFQIKEKFGGLRIYLTPLSYNDSCGLKEVFNIIDATEMDSHSICESCGDSGRSFVCDGWVYTLCKICIKSINGNQENE